MKAPALFMVTIRPLASDRRQQAKRLAPPPGWLSAERLRSRLTLHKMEEQAFRRLPPKLSGALVHRIPSMLEYKSLTSLDMPEVDVALVEEPEPDHPPGRHVRQQLRNPGGEEQRREGARGDEAAGPAAELHQGAADPPRRARAPGRTGSAVRPTDRPRRG